MNDLVSFKLESLEKLMQENKELGLLFPLLYAKNLNGQPIIRAKFIPSKKEPYACFACLAGSATRNKYNGIFFSFLEEALEKEGLAAITYVRLPAKILVEKVEDPLTGTLLDMNITVIPDYEKLEDFFNIHGAIFVTNKAHLGA